MPVCDFFCFLCSQRQVVIEYIKNWPITQNVGKKLFAIGFAYKHCNV